jgi:hypothetical protein
MPVTHDLVDIGRTQQDRLSCGDWFRSGVLAELKPPAIGAAGGASFLICPGEQLRQPDAFIAYQ